MGWKLKKTVVMVGMMGSGKTAIGTALARRLDVPFRDSDHELEEAANMTVAEVFARDGEAFFRELSGGGFEAVSAGTKPSVVNPLAIRAMAEVGIETLRSFEVHDLDEARRVAEEELDFPIIIRPSFTLGGTGGGFANNMEELLAIAEGGLKASLTTEVLLEESVLGWKEYEMEVMRDKKDNTTHSCNLGRIGLHWYYDYGRIR